MARRARVGAMLCAIGLLLVGCEGSVARRDLSHASPLAEFLGSPPRTQLGLPHLDEHERQRQDRHTELVGQCMRQAGFDYVTVSVEQRLGPTFLAAYDTGPEEFAQRYGYGITTIEVEEYADPNQEIRDGLPAAGRDEYDRTLWGGSGAVDGSCYQLATNEVYGDPAGLEEGLASFGELLEQVNDLHRSIDNDERLNQAHHGWARCLAEAGYPGFAAPSDARRSVFDRLPAGRLGGTASPAPGPQEPGPQEPGPQEPGPQEPGPQEPGPQEPGPEGPATAPDPQQLAEVRDYELALAPVDRECQRRHVDGPRRLVTIERENAFIAEHRADLERYRELLGG